MKNSNFKKTIASLLAAISVFSFAACNKEENEPLYTSDGSVSVSETSKSESSVQEQPSSASGTESSKNDESSKPVEKSQTSAEKSSVPAVSEPESSNTPPQESSYEPPQESYTPPQESSYVPPQESSYNPPQQSSDPHPVIEESGQYEIADVPEEWQDGGIFSHNYAEAYNMMKKMTLEEKVGQMILARCPASDGSVIAKKYHLGGYILFGRDFGYTKTKDEITKAVSSYTNSQKIPMIIAVDEEGGTVSRLQGNYNLIPHDFLSPRELYAQGGIEAIKDDANEKSKILSGLLINTNLAPVCDISKNPDDFMYSRSLGQNPDITADFVKAVTEISQKNGVSAALKHFPGYGNNVDTHTGIAIDKRNYATFQANDFIPFKAGINAGAHMVLVSHNIVECMDKDYPASLSPKVHSILREELGFTGIIITDDLAMDAISVYVKGYSPVVAAVIAGNDMLCVSDIQSTYNDVIEAVHIGRIEEEQIDHAVMRILAWKMSKNMI